MRKPTDNLIGQRFGRLTVVERAENYRHTTFFPNGKAVRSSIPMWRCVCDCGNEKTVLGANLKAGRTKSCGCYIKDWRKERMRED